MGQETKSGLLFKNLQERNHFHKLFDISQNIIIIEYFFFIFNACLQMRRMGFLFYWDNISLTGFQNECFLLQNVTSVQAKGWVLAAGHCWLTPGLGDGRQFNAWPPKIYQSTLVDIPRTTVISLSEKMKPSSREP